MVEQILRSISRSISQVGQETGQFRKAADGQNKSIGNFIKDVSKMFSSQNKQQASINTSLDDIQYNSQQTNSKVSQSNDLIQESISIQTQMLSELRSVSKGIGSLIEGLGLGGFGGGGGTGSKIASALMAGGIGATAGVLGSAGYDFLSQQSGVDASNFGGGQYAQTSVGGTTGQILDTIKGRESRGDYSITNKSGPGGSAASSASGAYQFIDSTWQALTKKFGVGTEFDRAKDAPSEIQDAVAAKYVEDILARHNNDISWVPREWFAGPDGDLSEKEQAANRGITVEGYVDQWMKEFAGNTRQNQNNPEGDESSAPANTLVQKSGVMGDTRSGVSELQQRLAGVRKLPLSSRLRGVLDQAAAAAGVEVVVYSGGQSPKGSGGPRTGSTRHDNGNAADLYLMKDGRKLSDTNAEDRAVMAKFVSSAVSAGATGVGAGHGYMGASNIHVGFGKQATWGGAPWIQSAASGIFNNKDLSAESGVFGGASTAGFTPTGNEGYDQYMSQLGGLGGLGSAAAMLTQAGTSLMSGMSGLSFDNIASVFNNTGSESSTNNEIEDKEESPNIESDSNASSKITNLTPQPAVDNRSTLINNNASQNQIASQMPSVSVSDRTQQGDIQGGQSGYTTTAGNMALNGLKDTTLPDWYRSLYGVGGGRVVPDGDFYQTLA
jgi:hypothetical protein